MLTPRKEMTDMMEYFRGLASDGMAAHYAELDTPTEEGRYWLVYYNGEDREGCNVFYSYLTKAHSRRNAVHKVAITLDEDIKRLDAIPKDLI